MAKTGDRLVMGVIISTCLIGLVGITYALVNGWMNADTLLQYLGATGATALYVAGVGSSVGALVYVWWSRRKRART